MTTTAPTRTIPTDDHVAPSALVEPAWVPPIQRVAPRLARLLHRRPIPFAEASARIAAYVYGNLVVLGVLLTLDPATAVSVRGAVTVLAAGLSTFVAHAFADLLAHRVGHGHRSVLHAAVHAGRSSLPVVAGAVLPVVVVGAGALFDWASGPTLLAAELVVCARIGSIGAAAERLRERPSSRRLVLVGLGIAVAAAGVAVVKVLIAGE